MDINIKNIIGGKRYKQAVNTNTNVQLLLENKNKPLTEYDINDVVNLQNFFSEEREKSKKYRFNGKLNMYTLNVLSSGATTNFWDPLFYGTPPINPTNWVMQMTYPSNMDSEYLITARFSGGTSYTSEAYRGLQYEKLGYTLIDNVPYLTVFGVQKHNLKVGDTIYLYSYLTNNSLTGMYPVRNLGINDTDMDKNLTLDVTVDITKIPSAPGNLIRMYQPSFDDLVYNNAANNIVKITSTDISGGTTGIFSVGETIYTKVSTFKPHDLVVGDFIDVRVGSISPLNGIWRVYNVVNQNNFIIKLNISTTKGQSTSIKPLPFWRRIDGFPSEYYIRYFEVLTSNQYEVYPCAFSTSIYANDLNSVANDTWLLQFNQDVDTTRLTDNRNGPISEVYYTIIKRAGVTPYNWTTVVADWDFNYKTTSLSNKIENISVNNLSGIGSIEKYSARTETIDSTGQIQVKEGSKYIGDFIDYNIGEIKETTIAEVIHRFSNTVSSQNGYYYKPFKKLELKVYSTVIETAPADTEIIDVPGNYVTYSDGTIAWRDLLPVGYYEEGTNGVYYPFLNGANYFYFNHNLFVRLQKPISIITPDDTNFTEEFVEKC